MYLRDTNESHVRYFVLCRDNYPVRKRYLRDIKYSIWYIQDTYVRTRWIDKRAQEIKSHSMSLYLMILYMYLLHKRISMCKDKSFEPYNKMVTFTRGELIDLIFCIIRTQNSIKIIMICILFLISCKSLFFSQKQLSFLCQWNSEEDFFQ